MRSVFLAFFFLFSYSAEAAFDPTNPGASGYVLVFDDEFNSIATIDVNDTKAPGYNWYVWNSWTQTATPASNFSVSGGVLTLTCSLSSTNCTAMMYTSIRSTSANLNGVGTNFAGGWYAEASIAFDHTLVNTSDGWPTFWFEAVPWLQTYH